MSCGTQVSARLSRTTTTGLSPSLARRSKRFVSSSRMPHRRPYNPRCITTSGLAFVPVRSPLLGESRLFSFPPGTEMFHFPGFARASLCIQPGVPVALASGGLPHSEIQGSKPVSGSPWLIAAVHVLRSLSSPRHPPRALRILTISLRRVHGANTQRLATCARSPLESLTLVLEIRIRCATESLSGEQCSILIPPRCQRAKVPRGHDSADR